MDGLGDFSYRSFSLSLTSFFNGLKASMSERKVFYGAEAESFASGANVYLFDFSFQYFFA